MRKYKIVSGILMLSLLAVILFRIILVPYGGGTISFFFPNGEMNYKSGEFSIGASSGGFVPSYYINARRPKVNYSLNLQNITQYNDINKNQQLDEGESIDNLSRLSMTDIEWDFNIFNFTIGGPVVDFSFTTASIENPFFDGVELSLVNHYIIGFSMIKVDLNITDWPFAEQATDFSVEFELVWDPTEQLLVDKTENRVFLKTSNDKVTAYFDLGNDISLDKEPSHDGANLSEPLVINSSKISFQVNYPRFNSSLSHDYIFGLSQNTIQPDIYLWFKEIETVFFLTLFFSTVTIIILILLLERRLEKKRMEKNSS